MMGSAFGAALPTVNVAAAHGNDAIGIVAATTATAAIAWRLARAIMRSSLAIPRLVHAGDRPGGHRSERHVANLRNHTLLSWNAAPPNGATASAPVSVLMPRPSA